MAKKHRVSELETHLGYWLRFASNHVSHAFKLKVEAQGATVAEWVVLRELLRLGAVNPSRLAESLGMTRGAISKLVDRVVEKGWAMRTLSAEDRRFQTVELTEAGRRLVPVLAALADENDAECFGSLSTEQREQLLQVLQTLVQQRGWKTKPVD